MSGQDPSAVVVEALRGSYSVSCALTADEIRDAATEVVNGLMDAGIIADPDDTGTDPYGAAFTAAVADMAARYHIQDGAPIDAAISFALTRLAHDCRTAIADRVRELANRT